MRKRPDDLIELGFALFEQIKGRTLTDQERAEIYNDYRTRFAHMWNDESGAHDPEIAPEDLDGDDLTDDDATTDRDDPTGNS